MFGERFVLKIVSGNEILTNQGPYLCYKFRKMTGKNPNLDLVNMNACTVNPLYNDTVCSKLSLTLK